MAESAIDRAIPFSGLMDGLLGLLTLALILANAKDVSTLVTGYTGAVTGGIKAVQGK